MIFFVGLKVIECIYFLQMEEKFRDKEKQLDELNKQIKTTRMKEMQVALDTLEKEVTRLKNEKLNQKNNKKHDNKNKEKKLKELTMTILRISEEKTRLMLENKSIKIEMQRCLELRNKTKNQFEEAMREMKKKNATIGGLGVEDLKRELNFLMHKVREKDETLQNMEKNIEKLKDENKKLVLSLKDVKKFHKVEKEKHEKVQFRNSISRQNTQGTSDSRKPPRKASINPSSRRNSSWSWEGTLDEAVEMVQAVVKNHNGMVENQYSMMGVSEEGSSDDDDSLRRAVTQVQTAIRFYNDV